MEPKCYWLLSDGKTVRELSFERYREMALKDMKEDKSSHLFAVVWDTEIHFGKGRRGITIRRRQLNEILRQEIES